MIERLKQGHWPIFLLSSISSFANLFLPIILVRLLTPEQIGLYKIFFLYFSALPFLFMSGGPLNSVYYWVGMPDKTQNEYLQSSWMLAFLFSLMIILVGIPLSSILAHSLNLSLKSYLIMLLCGFLWCPGSFFSEVKIAQGQRLKGALFSTSFEILKVILFITIAWYYKNLTYLFISYAGILSFKFIFTIINGLKNNTISFNYNSTRIKEVLNYCLPISASALLGFVVDKVDQLLLSHFLPTQDFAFYTMGCLIVPPLILIDMSVQKVLIPKLSKNYQHNNFSNAADNFKNAIIDISYLIIPAVAGLYFFSNEITTLLYTKEYLSSASFLKIFAFSYLLYCIPHDAIARASGHTKWIFKMYSLLAPLSLIIIYLFAVNTDAKTTLLASIFLKIIPKMAGLIYSKRLMDWKWAQILPYKAWLLYTAISIGLCFISYLTKESFQDSRIWFLTCAPIFAFIYLIMARYGKKI
ncbi:MAG: hypothetical protein CME66_05055 [Halobacteriovoraceae bacterium]|nr:hypothetical protein [Halobacteriovoraceae bacterium]